MQFRLRIEWCAMRGKLVFLLLLAVAVLSVASANARGGRRRGRVSRGQHRPRLLRQHVISAATSATSATSSRKVAPPEHRTGRIGGPVNVRFYHVKI